MQSSPTKRSEIYSIRKAIWDHMEANDIAQFPRPGTRVLAILPGFASLYQHFFVCLPTQVHHRIPNFQGADEAAERLATLPEFQSAQLVKVNPDTPQRQASLKSDYDNVLPRNANLLPLGSTIGSSKRQNFIDTTTSPEDWILLHAETRHGRDTFHHADREANIIEGCGKIRHADHLV